MAKYNKISRTWLCVRKELSIACCECLNCTCAKVGILGAAPLSLPSQDLNVNHMRIRKVVHIKLKRCFNARLDTTASFVGLKYVFISDCRWSRRGIATALLRWSDSVWAGTLSRCRCWFVQRGRNGRYNTYICRGSDCQIKPLGPNVFDVVSDVLEIVRDIITAGVRPFRHLDLSFEVLHSGVSGRKGISLPSTSIYFFIRWAKTPKSFQIIADLSKLQKKKETVTANLIEFFKSFLKIR